MVFLDIQTILRGITVVMDSDGSLLYLDDFDYLNYVGYKCTDLIVELKARGIFIQTVLLYRP